MCATAVYVQGILLPSRAEIILNVALVAESICAGGIADFDVDGICAVLVVFYCLVDGSSDRHSERSRVSHVERQRAALARHGSNSAADKRQHVIGTVCAAGETFDNVVAIARHIPEIISSATANERVISICATPETAAAAPRSYHVVVVVASQNSACGHL